jgi:hypothetical protein
MMPLGLIFLFSSHNVGQTTTTTKKLLWFVSMNQALYFYKNWLLWDVLCLVVDVVGSGPRKKKRVSKKSNVGVWHGTLAQICTTKKMNWHCSDDVLDGNSSYFHFSKFVLLLK